MTSSTPRRASFRYTEADAPDPPRPLSACGAHHQSDAARVGQLQTPKTKSNGMSIKLSRNRRSAWGEDRRRRSRYHKRAFELNGKRDQKSNNASLLCVAFSRLQTRRDRERAEKKRRRETRCYFFFFLSTRFCARDVRTRSTPSILDATPDPQSRKFDRLSRSTSTSVSVTDRPAAASLWWCAPHAERGRGGSGGVCLCVSETGTSRRRARHRTRASRLWRGTRGP